MSSVLKSKRGESAVQFLDTARELEIYTIKTCARFPKRYMFLVTKGIVDLSRQIYNDVKAANSIYPTNAAEAQLRKNYILQANCDLQCLISQLDVAKEMFGAEVKSNTWCSWMDLIEKQAKLISAVKKKDKERLKETPKES